MRLFVALLGCLSLSACVSPYATPPTPVPTVAVPTATPAPADPAVETTQRMIDIGGRELALYCTGSGLPTVILESGLDGDHASWVAVQPLLSEWTRVCSYDRANLGASDPAPTPRTAREVAADLKALLSASGEAGPFVLVGHSFGGLYTREFYAAYPELVAGMVLVDAVHPDWWQRAAALVPAPQASDSERLQAFRKFLAEDVADPSRNAEGIDIPASAEQVRAAGDLGDLPLIVLSAQRFDVLAPGLPADLQQQLAELWQVQLQPELVALSTDQAGVITPSGHAINREAPDMVVLAARSVAERVRKGP